MKTFITCVLVLLIFLISGCKQSKDNLSDNSKVKDSIAAAENIKQMNIQAEKTRDSILAVQESVRSSWVGNYNFSESSQSLNGITNMTWIYGIKVSKSGENGLTGYINVDGFQTISRFVCRIEYTESKLDLYLQGYGKGNQFKSYKTGDLLLTLDKSGNTLKTYWRKMKPQVKALSSAFKKSR